MMKLILIFSLTFFFSGAALAQTGEPQEEQPETAATAEPEAGRDPRYEAQFQVSQESLSNGFGTWRSASIYLERKFANRRLAWVNYRVSERNRTRDREFVAGIYLSFGRKAAVTAEAMFSSTHQYVGKFSVMGEAEKTFGRGWVAHFGARYTAYNLVKARTVYGLAEKYWGNNRAAYTLYVTNLTNAGTAPTHRFQYNRFFGEKLNSFGAAASFGKEHENLGPNIGILRNQTWSASVSNRYWLSKKIGLNVDASIHRQGDLYYRRSLNFGIRYRF